MDNIDRSVVNIETTLAYHDQKIEQMSDIITEQRMLIDALKARMSRLDGRIGQVEYGRNQEDDGLSSIEKARQEKPPHY